MPYGGDPSADPIDAVRYELQDTGASPLIADAEIQYEIDRQTPLNGADPILVASYLAEVIAARYAGEVSITADGVTYSGDQLQQKYAALAAALRARYDRLRAEGIAPVAGGTVPNDGALVGLTPTTFAIGMDDNLRAGYQRGATPGSGGWADPGDELL